MYICVCIYIHIYSIYTYVYMNTHPLDSSAHRDRSRLLHSRSTCMQTHAGIRRQRMEPQQIGQSAIKRTSRWSPSLRPRITWQPCQRGSPLARILKKTMGKVARACAWRETGKRAAGSTPRIRTLPRKHPLPIHVPRVQAQCCPSRAEMPPRLAEIAGRSRSPPPSASTEGVWARPNFSCLHGTYSKMLSAGWT